MNRPALDVIRQLDGPETLFYLDPPYLHNTRSTTNEYGRFEMNEADHRAMLTAIIGVRGKVMLSGYPSPMYDEALSDWTRHDSPKPNNAAGGKNKRRMIESVWCNFAGTGGEA